MLSTFLTWWSKFLRAEPSPRTVRAPNARTRSQHLQQPPRDRRAQRDRHGVADLPGDGGAGADEAVAVGEALEQGGLVVGDGPVLGRVQVAPLLRLEELCANRHRRAVRAEAPHDVHGARRVPAPAGRLELVRQVRAVAALRDRGEPLARDPLVRTGEVQLSRREGAGQFPVPDPGADLVEAPVHVGDGGHPEQRLADGPVREQSPRRLRSVGRLRESRRLQVPAVADDDGALTDLGRAVISGVEHPVLQGVVLEEPSRPRRGEEVLVLPRPAEGRDVLDDEVPGPHAREDLGVLPPEGVALVRGIPLAEGAEALARRPADDDVDVRRHVGPGQPVLDGAGEDIGLREGRGVGGRGRRVQLHGRDAAESVGGPVETRSQPAGPGEEVEDADGTTGHGASVAGPDDANHNHDSRRPSRWSVRVAAHQ